MKAKTLAIANFLSVVLVLVVNYYSQAFGINGNRVGQLSNQYENIFTPASYAFAIWGVIFFLLIIYSVYQLHQVFYEPKSTGTILKTGYWFLIANLMNAAWVVVWLYEFTGLSVIVMLLLLVSLLAIIVKNGLGKIEMSLKMKVFFQWPIAIYAGWISVATIANFSAFLAKQGWDGGFLSEEQWTLVMIVTASIVNLYMVVFRNLRSYALVGIWALYAIHVRHQSALELVDTFALMGSSAVLFAVVINGLKSGYSLVASKN